ncbi:hypothetical protein M2163_000968 [Streptomyces sp. SAI-135]|jgi:hypothetical protein|uniref:hypothetical protein n=1 Tax=unclassified Streptomyces TaxID=2593676 RepID=UPI002473DD73|nr:MULTISPECIES: hypothetical protein [unclassified Streptomyces]MDH6522522.1 hypothetical protein [Streptomyces sp. SAI-090]MDH6554142.1 hypothetical protein [Streptomyces sp. SAI-041]MDH6573407.1 hypothetical protein [Streptomyces sp. SAI-117]MDH6581839.1 hypothetical protein [Streptomyces sp. SAI-133]MDH6590111.1 hypothetical protein [Streptomyces sp. SAI-133]
MGRFTRRSGQDDGANDQSHWLEQAVGAGDADFDQAELLDDYAVLRWQTAGGGVGLAHSLIDGNASPQAVIRALRRLHGEHLADRYACVVAAQTGTQVTDPDVPQLLACDLNGTGRQYETTWAQLSAVLGQPAPYWFHSLRDRDAIAAWRPGAPPAVVPARDIRTPITALVELAADEPDGSPAAELCWYLAREIRRRGHASATRNIAELRKNAADGGDGAHLVLGAVPAPISRPAPQEPSEMVRRAGWLTITARRDVLAHRVADFSQRWDGGQDWHTGAMTAVEPDACPTAREWAARLVPAPSDKPPTVVEKVLLDNARDPDSDVLLDDPVAGVPVLHRALRTRNDDLFTYTLQRLPTQSPLAELILSNNTSWVRTQDGTLWLAPERDGWGIGFGYSGNGCHTLARLVDVLLDDISAPAVKPHDPEPPRGLFQLLRKTPADGRTLYTRTQLLAARGA